jgi:hypothetical protein
MRDFPIARWLAFALWLAGLFFLEGVLLEDPVAQSVIVRLDPTGRLTGMLLPFFTAEFQQ